MNGKKAKALRRLNRELNGHLPERAVKQYVDRLGRVIQYDSYGRVAPRVNRGETQHAKYKGLKDNYKRQMAK